MSLSTLPRIFRNNKTVCRTLYKIPVYTRTGLQEMEDTIEDRELYEKPTSGDRRAVEELNENLKETGVKIMRFIEQERGGCTDDGFVLSVEIKDFR